MVIAIAIAALAMVAAGAAAIATGAEVIVLERGWASVIAGSVVATGGMLLLGVAMVVRELRRLPAVASLGAGAVASAEAGTPASAGAIAPAVTAAALGAGVAAAGAAAPARLSATEPHAKGPDEAAESAHEDAAVATALDATAAPPMVPPAVGDEPRLAESKIGMPAFRRDAPASAERIEPVFPDFSLRGGGEVGLPPAPPEPAPMAATPLAADMAEPLPAPAQSQEDAKPAGDESRPADVQQEVDEEVDVETSDTTEPQIIGTYSAGGNLYVMFSDGSIAAETADGVYRFESLEDLKNYIAAGGAQPREDKPESASIT
jgi:hypothetical protein